MRKPWIGGCCLAALVVSAPTMAQERDSAHRWVSIWATAQSLSAPPDLKVPPPPAEVQAKFKSMPPRIVPFPDGFEDQTIRMIVRPSMAASTIRLQFSNSRDTPGVTINSVHAALRTHGAAIDPASDAVVTFGGKESISVPAGAIIVSDPISLNVRSDRDMAVSLYVKAPTRGVTVHALGLNPAYIVKGKRTSAPSLSGSDELRSYFWLTGIAADLPEASGTIVAYGDSITDGFATTPGTHNTWPEVLARRLKTENGSKNWAVVNMGISGNRVLRDGAGASAISRFDRDVLSRPGVKWIILLEGINDINMSQMKGLPADQKASAQDIIAGLKAIIAKAHLHGIKVMGATITPTEGLWLYTPASEAARQTINRWIRTSGTFDAIADFDAAVRDPNEPAKLLPEFDSGDHVHPNDLGTRKMGQSIDLRAFGQ